MFAYEKLEQKNVSKSIEQKKGTEKPVIAPNLTGIPDQMKTRFENMSGFSFDDVRVHYNSDKPAQLQALAYTQGNQVYVAPGQDKYLGHELGHVVQQKANLVAPTGTIQNHHVNDDMLLEREADNLANKETFDFFRSENSRISAPSGVIQRIRIKLQQDDEALFEELSQVKISGDTGPIVNVFMGNISALKGISIQKNESIVFMGHGISDPRQGGKVVAQAMYPPHDIAQIAKSIQKPDDWNGKIVLLGCQTGDIASQVSESYFGLTGKEAEVIGTPATISISRGHTALPFVGMMPDARAEKMIVTKADLLFEKLELVLSSIKEKTAGITIDSLKNVKAAFVDLQNSVNDFSRLLKASGDHILIAVKHLILTIQGEINAILNLCIQNSRLAASMPERRETEYITARGEIITRFGNIYESMLESRRLIRNEFLVPVDFSDSGNAVHSRMGKSGFFSKDITEKYKKD